MFIYSIFSSISNFYSYSLDLFVKFPLNLYKKNIINPVNETIEYNDKNNKNNVLDILRIINNLQNREENERTENNNDYYLHDYDDFQLNILYIIDKNNDSNDEFYKIVQNILNGMKLTKKEFKFIKSLSKNEVIDLLLLYDYCLETYIRIIKDILK